MQASNIILQHTDQSEVNKIRDSLVADGVHVKYIILTCINGPEDIGWFSAFKS